MSDQQTTRFNCMKKPHLTAALLLAIFAAGALIAWWAVAQADRDMRADLLQRTQIVAHRVRRGADRYGGGPGETRVPPVQETVGRRPFGQPAIPVYLSHRPQDRRGALLFHRQ
ncbi:MAG: hypothetical protein WCR46_10130 [Deltaproteobacteria bacterium]